MKKTIKLFFLIIFIWLALSAFSIVNAATAEIKAKPTSVNVGEKVTVTVTVDAAAWNLKVSGSASGKIIGYNGEGLNQSTTKTYTIDTSKEGTYTVALTGDVTDQSKKTPDIINKSVSITVKPKQTNNGGSNNNAGTNTGTNNGTTNNNTGTNNSTTNNNSGTTTEQPKTKSTNAYLSTLGVRLSESVAKELGVASNAYDFSGFKKTTKTYNVTVPYEVDSLKVSYKAADSGATVKVTGNSGFEVGSKNKITIKVTAEDGKATQTYTIKVTKLAEEEEKPGNIIDEEIEELYLTSLSIKGIELSPKFAKDVYAYTAILEELDVKEVEVNAVANKENANIEISGNIDLVVGENTINIVLKEEGTAQIVYQITLTKNASLVTTTDKEVNFMSSLIENIKNYVIIAVGVVVLIIVAIAILIILLKKENKKLKNEETEDEYNVYENDENEFENNTVKETVEEEVTNETETKNVRRTRRREKGRHSK